MLPNGAWRWSLSSRNPKANFFGLRGEGEMRGERFGFIRAIRVEPSVAAGAQNLIQRPGNPGSVSSKTLISTGQAKSQEVINRVPSSGAGPEDEPGR
jgi:hypothetical protein